MCWKPRNNNWLSQSKEGIKHQSFLLKSFGYYSKSLKSVLKARHAIRQPSTLSAQGSHIPAISEHFLMWSMPRLHWQCPDRTCFTLHCPLSPVLSCSSPQLLSLHNDDILSLHLGLTRFAAELLAAGTHSTYLLLWSNSQTSAKLISFPNWLKAESKYVFKQRESSPNEIAPSLLYKTHCDLRNTDCKYCCTEKFLLPRTPPNINSSSNSEM